MCQLHCTASCWPFNHHFYCHSIRHEIKTHFLMMQNIITFQCATRNTGLLNFADSVPILWLWIHYLRAEMLFYYVYAQGKFGIFSSLAEKSRSRPELVHPKPDNNKRFIYTGLHIQQSCFLNIWP